MRHPFGRTWVWVSVSLCLLAGFASAQRRLDNGAFQQRLDAPVKFAAKNLTIGEVFRQLSTASGVSCEIVPETLALLPYGEKTRLTVTIPGVSLRKALSQLLSPQALAWDVDAQTIRILPAEPLYRLGRRATYDELELLGKILTTSLRQVPKEAAPAAILRKTLGDSAIQLVLPATLLAREQAEQVRRANLVLPATAAEWLTRFAGPGQTWYLDGKRIHVISQAAQVKRQLTKKVSLRYQNIPLTQVLLDLARKGRVKLTLTPGVMALLPANIRDTFTLVMDDASIEQALEVIAGATGLEFVPSAQGLGVKPSLYMQVSSNATPVAAEKKKRPSFFIQSEVKLEDGKVVKLYLIPEQVPAALQAAIEAERARLVKQLEKKYGVDGDEKTAPKTPAENPVVVPAEKTPITKTP